MNFSNFFNSWLYLEDGYYTNYKAIGKEGDFYTAVSTSKFFGGSIAKRLIESIKEGFLDENTTVLEIGAHRGYLLADIIEFIYTIEPMLLNTLTFAILEPFENLQKIQKEYFDESFGGNISFKHYSNFDELDKEYFIVANEILDAFPCELVLDNKKATVNKKFELEFNEPLDDKLKALSQKYNIFSGEVAVGYDDFAKSLSNIKKFEFVTFDYGALNHRGDFSIRVYKNHETFSIFDTDFDFKDFYKISDITYDVVFQHFIDECEAKNIKTVEFKTQMSALINFGLLELLEILKAKTNEAIYLKELNRVKNLIEPSLMGERFKMLRLRKS